MNAPKKALIDAGVAEALTALGNLKRPPIDDDVVRQLVTRIDAAGIPQQLAQWHIDDHGPSTGRPAAINHRATLVLLLIMSLEHSPLLVSHMSALLEHRLSESAKAHLNVTDRPGTNSGWYDRCWRAMWRLLAVVDPYAATPKGQRVVRGTPRELLPDPASYDRKRARMDWLANQLVELSWSWMPREHRRRWKGNVCVDATAVKAFARGTTKRRPETSEPEGGWYVREGDHRDPGDEAGKAVKRSLYGYETHLTIATDNTPGVEEFPLLVAAMSFDAPGMNIAENAMITLDSIAKRGMPRGLLAGDRAYLPNSKVDKLQDRARGLGFELVFDYRNDQLGVQDGFGGSILVEGNFYCPSMPAVLVDATIDYRAGRIDDETYALRIQERRLYLLSPKERPDADGYQPLRCPAVGPSATAKCPLRESSFLGKNVGRRVTITSVPRDPDRICTQGSVSFPPSAGAKYRQLLQYGSAEWKAMYASARNTIEGFNAFIKDTAREALAEAGRRRVRGRAAQHLFVAVLVVSANYRKIETFLQSEAVVADSAPRPVRKRRRESLANHTPPTPSGTSPPGVAA